MVFKPNSDLLAHAEAEECRAIPVLSRRGGLLLAVPYGCLSADAILEAMLAVDESSLLGPSHEFIASLLEEDESGNEVVVDAPCQYVVIDVTDDALPALREYDPVIDPSSQIVPFDADRPLAIVNLSTSLSAVLEWLESIGGTEGRAIFTALERSRALLGQLQRKQTPRGLRQPLLHPRW